VTKIYIGTFVNLVKPKAGSMHELLINKMALVPKLPMLMQQKNNNYCICVISPKLVKASTVLPLFEVVLKNFAKVDKPLSFL
jgi:hypothetical protein